MEPHFQICFDSEYTDIGAFKLFIQEALEINQISNHYRVEDIITAAYQQCTACSSEDSIVEVELAWLKTNCLENIKQLGQAYNKKKFDQAVQALFDSKNPDARTFLSTIQRLLNQHRLSGTYEVKEIISEGYAIGVKHIQSGKLIQIPLAWLRVTCFNVIRDFKRKQNQADKPKFDREPWTVGDEMFSELVFQEDLQAIYLAVEQLSLQERKILHQRIFHKLTWQQIGESMSDEGSPLSSGAARQRGFRALERLRRNYDSIREDVKVSVSEDN